MSFSCLHQMFEPGLFSECICQKSPLLRSWSPPLVFTCLSIPPHCTWATIIYLPSVALWNKGSKYYSLRVLLPPFSLQKAIVLRFSINDCTFQTSISSLAWNVAEWLLHHPNSFVQFLKKIFLFIFFWGGGLQQSEYKVAKFTVKLRTLVWLCSSAIKKWLKMCFIVGS